MTRHPTKPEYVGLHSAVAHRYFKRAAESSLSWPLDGPCQECPDRGPCNAGRSTCPSIPRTKDRHGFLGHPVWVKEETAVAALLED